MQDITVEELKKKMEAKEDFIFLDVREQAEYEQHNLGAELIPLGNLSQELHRFEDDKDKEIIIHCRSGMRSGVAKQLMVGEGYTNVRNVLGGILAWEAM